MVTEGKGEKYGENSNEKLCRHPEVELRRDRMYKIFTLQNYEVLII
jgi:hypothetical protein